MRLLLKNKGFTLIEVVFAVGILLVFVGIFLHLENYSYSQRRNWDEINKMTMTAQGVMDGYRVLGRVQALTLGQGYTIDITEDTNTGHSNLKKVTVTVTPNITELSNITLVSYHSS